MFNSKKELRLCQEAVATAAKKRDARRKGERLLKKERKAERLERITVKRSKEQKQES